MYFINFADKFSDFVVGVAAMYLDLLGLYLSMCAMMVCLLLVALFREVDILAEVFLLMCFLLEFLKHLFLLDEFFLIGVTAILYHDFVQLLEHDLVVVEVG